MRLAELTDLSELVDLVNQLRETSFVVFPDKIENKVVRPGTSWMVQLLRIEKVIQEAMELILYGSNSTLLTLEELLRGCRLAVNQRKGVNYETR